jgi:hypothetical protein
MTESSFLVILLYYYISDIFSDNINRDPYTKDREVDEVCGSLPKRGAYRCH